MESEIFKFICANSGALSTDDLVNVGSADLSRVISNRERFVLWHFWGDGQPEMVVARTQLRLCRAPSCPGTCQALHLCKSILFGAPCPFSQRRRGCNFSHELNTEHNERILREHQVESLSAAELLTLLLQNDNSLLPPICFDYNNGDGEFGRCESGDSCERLHVCQRHLRGVCSCARVHGFKYPQPLKILTAKDLPEKIIHSLKSVYRNRMALWQAERAAATGLAPINRPRGGGGFRGYRGNRGNRGNWRSRGYRGGRATQACRGNWGSAGSRGGGQQLQRCISTSDLIDLGNFDLYTEDGLGEDGSQASASHPSADGDGQSRRHGGPYVAPAAAAAAAAALAAYRGSGGNRGNRGTAGSGGSRGGLQQRQRSSSVSDLLLDLDAFGSGGGGAAEVRRSGGRSGGPSNHQPDDGTCLSAGNDSNSPSSSSDGVPNNEQRHWPARDKTQICLDFIKGSCRYEEQCCHAHDKMPYRWEAREGSGWTALPDNEAIEQAYCCPERIYSGPRTQVHFDTMTRGPNKVRRLSTCSSVDKPTSVLTTKWIWYWEDDTLKWNKYAASSEGDQAAEMDSTSLEARFQAGNQDVVEFRAGSNFYSLSFQDMIQTNKSYGTRRPVRRRPCFVSAADVERARKPQQQTVLDLPDHWDETMIPATGYQLVSLLSPSEEYQEIEALFRKSMRDVDVISIQRIQNKELWESYQLQKIQMKAKNNGWYPAEMKLFHGTLSKHVHDVCLTNVDLTPSNPSGSYFARSASSSHRFTGVSEVRSMFLAQVLVGEDSAGAAGYRRPPSRDGENVNLYDSCVDDARHPSIFVVSDKREVYPAYVLNYKMLSASAKLRQKTALTKNQSDSCAVA